MERLGFTKMPNNRDELTEYFPPLQEYCGACGTALDETGNCPIWRDRGPGDEEDE